MLGVCVCLLKHAHAHSTSSVVHLRERRAKRLTIVEHLAVSCLHARVHSLCARTLRTYIQANTFKCCETFWQEIPLAHHTHIKGTANLVHSAETNVLIHYTLTAPNPQQRRLWLIPFRHAESERCSSMQQFSSCGVPYENFRLLLNFPHCICPQLWRPTATGLPSWDYFDYFIMKLRHRRHSAALVVRGYESAFRAGGVELGRGGV